MSAIVIADTTLYPVFASLYRQFSNKTMHLVESLVHAKASESPYVRILASAEVFSRVQLMLAFSLFGTLALPWRRTPPRLGPDSLEAIAQATVTFLTQRRTILPAEVPLCLIKSVVYLPRSLKTAAY